VAAAATGEGDGRIRPEGFPIRRVIAGRWPRCLAAALYAWSGRDAPCSVVDAVTRAMAPALMPAAISPVTGASPSELLSIAARGGGYGGDVVEGNGHLHPASSRVVSASGPLTAGVGMHAGAGNHRSVDELPTSLACKSVGRDVVHCPSVLVGSSGCTARRPRQRPHGAAKHCCGVNGAPGLRSCTPPPTRPTTGSRADRPGHQGCRGPVATVEVNDDHLSGVRLCSGRVRRASRSGDRSSICPRDRAVGDLGRRTAEHPLGIGFQVSSRPHGAARPCPDMGGGNGCGRKPRRPKGLPPPASAPPRPINANLTAEDTPARCGSRRKAVRGS